MVGLTHSFSPLAPLFLALGTLAACGGNDSGVKVHNGAPEAEITSHVDGEELLEGDAVTFQGSVTDDDDASSTLLAVWYMNDEEICPLEAPDSAGRSTCAVVMEPSMSDLRLEAIDPQDAVGAAAIGITVIETEAPEATIFLPDGSETYYADGVITFQGQVSDEEDEAELLLAWWESDLDGVLGVEAIPDANGEFIANGYLGEGEHLLTLHAEDTDGKTGSATTGLTVRGENNAPACEITSPEDGSAGTEDLCAHLHSICCWLNCVASSRSALDLNKDFNYCSVREDK